MWGILLACSVLLGGLSCLLVAFLLWDFFRRRKMGGFTILSWCLVIFFVFDALGHLAVMFPKPANIVAFAICGVAKFALLPIVYVLIRELSPFPMPGEFGTEEARQKLEAIQRRYDRTDSNATRSA